jgi:hypothetical protein
MHHTQLERKAGTRMAYSPSNARSIRIILSNEECGCLEHFFVAVAACSEDGLNSVTVKVKPAPSQASGDEKYWSAGQTAFPPLLVGDRSCAFALNRYVFSSENAHMRERRRFPRDTGPFSQKGSARSPFRSIGSSHSAQIWHTQREQVANSAAEGKSGEEHEIEISALIVLLLEKLVELTSLRNSSNAALAVRPPLLSSSCNSPTVLSATTVDSVNTYISRLHLSSKALTKTLARGAWKPQLGLCGTSYDRVISIRTFNSLRCIIDHDDTLVDCGTLTTQTRSRPSQRGLTRIRLSARQSLPFCFPEYQGFIPTPGRP